MNRIFAATAILALASAPVLARDDVIYDYATVIEADPIVKTYRVSTPREECWQEDVVYRSGFDDYGRDNHAVGTVLGGVVGGAIGNAVGHKKRNKQVGVVVGTVLGATLGHAISSSNGYDRPRDVGYDAEDVCRIYHDYHEEERIVGYHVRYRYANQTFSTRTTRDPGDTIKVRLAVSPVI